MTTLSNLDKQGQATVGITLSNTDNFTFDISQMNAVITAYNTANSTNYPTWDNVGDNFEKFVHYLLVFCKIQNLILGNNTLNLKWISTTPGTQVWGTRGALNSRAISLAFPFTGNTDVEGDTDNLG